MKSEEAGKGKVGWKKSFSRIADVTVTLLYLGVAAGAVVTGYTVLAARAAISERPAPAPLTEVRPRILRIQHTLTLPRRFTGQFEAAQDVALAFEEGGTIAEIRVREGEKVGKGDLLATLDTRLLEAEQERLDASRRALEAQVELARRTDERQAALLEKGHVTQQRVDETSLQLARLQASLAEINAGLAAVQVRLSKSEIRAPFAGRVGKRLLDTGAVAGPAAGVLTLLEDGPKRFRVALDPALAARLAPGHEVEIEVAATRLKARLSDLSPELDPATRSRMTFFDLPDDAATPPARTGGEVIIDDTSVETGSWVPVAALRQGPRGTWTLLTLSENADGSMRVGTEAAEVLHLDADRAFVRGSFPDNTLYLPSGTHRVVPGEVVSIAESD